jgi:hypothetical protein
MFNGDSALGIVIAMLSTYNYVDIHSPTYCAYYSADGDCKQQHT